MTFDTQFFLLLLIPVLCLGTPAMLMWSSVVEHRKIEADLETKRVTFLRDVGADEES